MNKTPTFHKHSESEIKNLIRNTFKNTPWMKVFLDDTHHGLTHGIQVKESCMKLVKELTYAEEKKLLEEGQEISDTDPHDYALSAITIAAIFHDCGRFNDNGEIIEEEQKDHHILSAKRAKTFCEDHELSALFPVIEEAILCHDFQSKKLSPDLNSPSTIVGKIVQSSDQMGWFHPNSVSRTLDYNNAIGVPFYDPETTIEERLEWKPRGTSKDIMSVLVNQLFGPRAEDRFGIKAAQEKIEKYKIELEINILKTAADFNVEEEVKSLIEEFRNKRGPAPQN